MRARLTLRTLPDLTGVDQSLNNHPADPAAPDSARPDQNREAAGWSPQLGAEEGAMMYGRGDFSAGSWQRRRGSPSSVIEYARLLLVVGRGLPRKGYAPTTPVRAV